MRLEKENNQIKVWTTGSQKNTVQYDSEIPIDNFRRRDLVTVMDFLYENKETIEANKIRLHLGKLFRHKTIPQLIPTGNYQTDVHLSYLQKTIKNFIDEENLDLDPDFQRGHVWNNEQRVRFVEFILQDGKTNPIYFNNEGWDSFKQGEFVIVDGKQRLTALLMFLNNELPVFKNLDSENIGYYADDFDRIPNTITLVINDLKTRKQVLEWYLQMNRGNIAHTEPELQKVETLIRIEQAKEAGLTVFGIAGIYFVVSKEDHQKLDLNHYVVLRNLVNKHRDTIIEPIHLDFDENDELKIDLL